MSAWKQKLKKAKPFVTGFWFFDVFRIFSANKRMYSYTLNLLGIQAFRAWLADRLQKKRRQQFMTPDITAQGSELQKKGFTEIRDFVKHDFEALRQECKHAFEHHPEAWTRHEAGGVYRKVPLRPDNLDDYPHLKKFIEDPILRSLSEYNQGGKLDLPDMGFVLLRVMTDVEAEKDANQDMHVDTFHATTKGWLYLDDVEMKDGPLTYLEGSNVVDKWRLNFEYRNSLKYESNGSWRIPPEEAEKKFGKELAFTVPKNTMIVADTMGFHRRGDAEKGVTRDTIHFSARTSPFFKI